MRIDFYCLVLSNSVAREKSEEFIFPPGRIKDRVTKTKKHSLSAVYRCGIIYIYCKCFPCDIPYHIVLHDSLVTDKNMLSQMNKIAV